MKIRIKLFDQLIEFDSSDEDQKTVTDGTGQMYNVKFQNGNIDIVRVYRSRESFSSANPPGRTCPACKGSGRIRE